MRNTIIVCDICGENIEPQGWETTPRRFFVITECTSQNPMERITQDRKFQENKFCADDTCWHCMKFMAETIASAIESRRNLPNTP